MAESTAANKISGKQGRKMEAIEAKQTKHGVYPCVFSCFVEGREGSTEKKLCVAFRAESRLAFNCIFVTCGSHCSTILRMLMFV